MQELHFLHQQNIAFTLSMCVTEANVLLMPEIIELAADVGAANVHFMWYFIRGRGQSESFVLPQQIFTQLQAAAAKGQSLTSALITSRHCEPRFSLHREPSTGPVPAAGNPLPSDRTNGFIPPRPWLG